MADIQLNRVIVNLSCGQPEAAAAERPLAGRRPRRDRGRPARHPRQEGRGRSAEDGRETVHAFPLGFTVDATPGADDPRGMLCEHIAARLHVVDAAQASLRNLGATLLRCDLEVEELVSAPLAAGLATLVEDEKQLGATVHRHGRRHHRHGGLRRGPPDAYRAAPGRRLERHQRPRPRPVHPDRPCRAAEDPAWRRARRPGRRTGMLPVPQVGEEEDQIARVPRAMVIGIIRPRLEETFELVRDRLEARRPGPEPGRAWC